ncbi:MAG TPA: response regulator [Pirellulaceae bacterium]|jgi:CheY-like chemotaxis protein
MANREPPSIEPEGNVRREAPQAPAPAEKKPLAKIVHELRNPLSAFTTALHLINTQPDQPDLIRQLAGMMTQQLDRFTQLIEELAAFAADAKSKPACNAESTSPAGESLPMLKILLVDDNQSATHMMSRLLEKLGQEVQTANSAAAALDQLPSFAPDFVISDIAMPAMSGYDLARRIRELDLPKKPYLVAFTGYGQESDRQEALAAGFDKHLTKPVGVAALEDLLRTCGCSAATS